MSFFLYGLSATLLFDLLFDLHRSSFFEFVFSHKRQQFSQYLAHVWSTNICCKCRTNSKGCARLAGWSELKEMPSINQNTSTFRCSNIFFSGQSNLFKMRICNEIDTKNDIIPLIKTLPDGETKEILKFARDGVMQWGCGRGFLPWYRES